MSAKKRSQHYGKCFLCGKSAAKGGLTRHLRKHIAERSTRGDSPLLWLRVESEELPQYFWLDLEMPEDLGLDELDDFLRATWLECCGHLSHFILGSGWGSVYYERYRFDDGMGLGPTYAMEEVTVGQLADRSESFGYEYDYGSTTPLRMRVMARYTGPAPDPDQPIRLLGRNYKPDVRCVVCGRPAVYWDVSVWEPRPYCEEHMDQAEDEEMLLPIVNSPRSGVCAYRP